MRTSDDHEEIAAGQFSTWLASVRGAIAHDDDSEVPCDGCTACCTSSQFVHIAPDEADTLNHVPAELLFPAPGRPPGHVLLGYDERGHCPMLVDDECSIYAHRPRTCRTYDCRVFPASGVEPGGAMQVAIARRARRWRFSEPTDVDRIERAAVRAAARYVDEHREPLTEIPLPIDSTQVAVLAVEIHDVFLHRDGAGSLTVVDPEPDAVAGALHRAVTRSRTRRA